MNLYDDGAHKFILLKGMRLSGDYIWTNEYMVVEKGYAVLIDPGSIYSFFQVYDSILDYVSPEDIKVIFYSHQDPDVASGVTMLMANTKADVYVSKLWKRFISHFGIKDMTKIKEIPDHGMSITLPSGNEIEFIPAHFLHSVGNFSLYDKKSGILFSGDIGASIVTNEEEDIFVEDFNEHLAKMESFHKRYMQSNIVCRKWVEEIRKRNINMIAPQHGKIFKGENVNKFLNWLYNLRCGLDILDEIYPKT
ncbi:oxygen-binding di-iron domain-containing protein [Hydrogenobaculum acidophilum]